MALRSVPSVEWQRGFEACQEAVIALCKEHRIDCVALGSRDGACRAAGALYIMGKVRELSPRRGP